MIENYATATQQSRAARQKINEKNQKKISFSRKKIGDTSDLDGPVRYRNDDDDDDAEDEEEEEAVTRVRSKRVRAPDGSERVTGRGRRRLSLHCCGAYTHYPPRRYGPSEIRGGGGEIDLYAQRFRRFRAALVGIARLPAYLFSLAWWCAEFNACVYAVCWCDAAPWPPGSWPSGRRRRRRETRQRRRPRRARNYYIRRRRRRRSAPAAANKWFARNSVRDARSPTRTPIAVVKGVCCLCDIIMIIILPSCFTHHSRGGSRTAGQIIITITTWVHVVLRWLFELLYRSYPYRFCLD